MKKYLLIITALVSVTISPIHAESSDPAPTFAPNADQLLADHPPQTVVINGKDSALAIEGIGPLSMEHIYGKVEFVFGASFSDIKGTKLAYPAIWIFRDTPPDQCKAIGIQNGIAYYQAATPEKTLHDPKADKLPPAKGLVPIRKVDLKLSDQELAKLFSITADKPSFVDIFPTHLYNLDKAAKPAEKK